MNKFDINVDPQKDEYVLTFRFKCNENRRDINGITGGTYSEITGVLNTEDNRFGFAYTIDMDYKGKSDQYTQTIIYLDSFMEEVDFIKLCDDWSIPMAVE